MRFVVSLLLMILAAPLAHASEFEDGMQAYRDKDYGTARLLWLPLAESGHTFAMNNVGMMYKKGYGVPGDYKKLENISKNHPTRGSAWPAIIWQRCISPEKA